MMIPKENPSTNPAITAFERKLEIHPNCREVPKTAYAISATNAVYRPYCTGTPDGVGERLGDKKSPYRESGNRVAYQPSPVVMRQPLEDGYVPADTAPSRGERRPELACGEAWRHRTR